MSKEDGTLLFTQGSDLNKGVYQCFPRNQYGKAMSNLVNLTRATISTYPQNVLIKHREGNVGDHIMIPCQPLNSYPAPIITWSLVKSRDDKNSIGFALDNRVNIDEHGK